jgi:GT2 family glycosyltransferase
MTEPDSSGASVLKNVGAVAIGRNEGERLCRCLDSLPPGIRGAVYVDSGSDDDSVAQARRRGVEVVDLDRSVGFTAARARNAGMERLLAVHPEVTMIQFVDGDCELAPGWIELGARQLLSLPDLAAVCGRRRERHPDASIYNRLCDLEWQTPVGFTDACGGDALIRVQPLVDVAGYNPTLIAGEEPDLCLRMRQAGWRILRLDAEMTLHDAAMTRFGQWWKRSLRAGHAYAEGSALHKGEGERYWEREVRSNWLWGLGVPGAAAALALPTAGLSLGLLWGHAVLAGRVYASERRKGVPASDARLYAAFCALGKLPQALGQALYWKHRLTHERGKIIEYKSSGS